MFIVQIDTDGYDYPDVYGPFDTEEQALAFEADYRERYPEMNNDDSLTFTAVRVLTPNEREATDNPADALIALQGAVFLARDEGASDEDVHDMVQQSLADYAPTREDEQYERDLRDTKLNETIQDREGGD